MPLADILFCELACLLLGIVLAVPIPEQFLAFRQPLFVTSSECLLEFSSHGNAVPVAQGMQDFSVFAGHTKAHGTIGQLNFANQFGPPSERGNISESYRVAVSNSPDCSGFGTALKSQQSSVTEQHTLGHVACTACEVQRTAVIVGSAELAFENAAQIWLQQHALYISARTLKDYKQYLKPLCSFLGPALLMDIHIGTVRSYQAWRMQKASNHLVNSEIRSVLKPVMREAGLWEPIAALYKPLLVDRSGAGKSYSDEQRQKLLTTAFSRKHWHLAGHCLNVMLHTGVGFGELRQLRREDVRLDGQNPEIYVVKGAKNRHRIRPVPLNADALPSMKWIVERWQRKGGKAPDQYILPKGSDFYAPMGSIKTAFYAIRKQAGLPSAPYKGMRVYDCRVTAITESLSSGKVSLQTAKLLYGHVSEEMQKRYYKPQMDVLREAVAALQKKPVSNQRLQSAPTLWISSTTH